MSKPIIKSEDYVALYCELATIMFDKHIDDVFNESPYEIDEDNGDIVGYFGICQTSFCLCCFKCFLIVFLLLTYCLLIFLVVFAVFLLFSFFEL